jgi:hypothetical protein
VLIILFAGAGVAYVYYTGKDSNAKDEQPLTAPEVKRALPKPRMPGPNAPVGVAVESLTTPVAQGANASLIIKTNATSTCKIVVAYNNVPAKDSGLADKVADDYGLVTWTWTVDPTAAPGSWPVKVTCGYHGKTGFVQTTLQVTKPQ